MGSAQRKYWLALGGIGVIAIVVLVIALTSGTSTAPSAPTTTSTTVAAPKLATSPKQLSQVLKQTKHQEAALAASDLRVQTRLYQISIALTNNFSGKAQPTAAIVVSELHQSFPTLPFQTATSATLPAEHYQVSVATDHTITVATTTLAGTSHSLTFNASQGTIAFH